MQREFALRNERVGPLAPLFVLIYLGTSTASARSHTFDPVFENLRVPDVVPGVSVQRFSYGRGIGASAPLKSGTLIHRLPAVNFIKPHHFDEVLQELGDNDTANVIDYLQAGFSPSKSCFDKDISRMKLALLLYLGQLLLENNADDVFWGALRNAFEKVIPVLPAYVVQLPSTCDNIFTWTTDDVRMLQGTDTLKRGVGIFRRTQQLHRALGESLSRVPSSVFSTCTDGHHDGCFVFPGWETSARFYCLVASRKFDEHGLVPVLDLYNHACRAEQVNIEYNQSGVFTTQNVPAGSELLSSFGERANSELLRGYGFVCFNNSYDVLSVYAAELLQFSAHGPDISKYRVFEALNLTEVFLSRELREPLKIALHLASLPKHEFLTYGITRVLRANMVVDYYPFSKLIQHSSHKILLQWVKQRLAQFANWQVVGDVRLLSKLHGQLIVDGNLGHADLKLYYFTQELVAEKLILLGWLRLLAS